MINAGSSMVGSAAIQIFSGFLDLRAGKFSSDVLASYRIDGGLEFGGKEQMILIGGLLSGKAYKGISPYVPKVRKTIRKFFS